MYLNPTIASAMASGVQRGMVYTRVNEPNYRPAIVPFHIRSRVT